MQRIVVGVDGSAASKAALRWAADAAGRMDAALEVVGVWHYPPPYHEWDARPSNYGFLPVVPDHDLAERMARYELADTVDEVLGPEPTVPLDQRVIRGHAAEVLVEASRDAELLVVGRRGRGRLETLLLGSIARRCSELASCPVVIISADAGDRAARRHARVAEPAASRSAVDAILGGPVVAGVDGSDSALRAAGWAAREAVLRRVPLRLVHSVHAAAVLGRTFAEALESDGHRCLKEAEAAVRTVHPAAELEIEVDLRRGAASPVLVDLSRTSGLIVLGARGSGGFDGVHVGSIAAALVEHGHCPVAVIRGGQPGDAPPATGPVVVGVDGSPAGEAAIAVAFAEASLREVDLVAVHTWTDYSTEYDHAYTRQFLIDVDRVQAEAEELLAQRLAGWQDEYPDVRVQRFVARDQPVRTLLDRAAQAQLLVVGSRGRGGFAGMLLGSTSRALLHHASCPLIVARPVPRSDESARAMVRTARNE